MPEGHALHRLARRQQRQFGGQRVQVQSPQGRFGPEAALLDGMRFATAEAWGKHLVYTFDDGPEAASSARMVHIHLGIYGAFTEEDLPMPDPVGQVRMRMIGTDLGVDLRGPNACELYTPPDLDALLARLGPDPLRADADPAQAAAAIARSRRAIGSLLMDQKVIAGVGNIYRAEVLFRAGIDPLRPGTSLTAEEFAEIWADLVALMAVGAERGRIHVVRPDHDHGAPAYAANRPRTYVYRRAGEPCRLCGTPIAWQELEGRNLFWCPSCQS
ncbi:Fpg/Nei family DNA glycosylase [Gordonia alkaliphila]|uniref:Fpg/Nei family DNA glycosylase n=1 Tax=Gordonia alkaliphila TaxID=1053547 RepID=UPI001FF6F99F|nr:DNA-formamidopyrimidine glycosylase family protein [Gordonia alkaliphila]MCK0440280.1 Fpg/Nei family DNA glycosylase [Gordonia alkaliphila]